MGKKGIFLLFLCFPYWYNTTVEANSFTVFIMVYRMEANKKSRETGKASTNG